MNKYISFCIRVVCLALLSNMALTVNAKGDEFERNEFEREFIGKTWRSESLRVYPLSGECLLVDGKTLQQDRSLIVNNFTCSDGQQLSTMSEKIGLNSLRIVLDAFLFPKLQEGEAFMFAGECSLNGDTLTDFTAQVRMGERERVDWQTGVLRHGSRTSKQKGMSRFLRGILFVRFLLHRNTTIKMVSIARACGWLDWLMHDGYGTVTRLVLNGLIVVIHNGW